MLPTWLESLVDFFYLYLQEIKKNVCRSPRVRKTAACNHYCRLSCCAFVKGNCTRKLESATEVALLLGMASRWRCDFFSELLYFFNKASILFLGHTTCFVVKDFLQRRSVDVQWKSEELVEILANKVLPWSCTALQL